MKLLICSFLLLHAVIVQAKEIFYGEYIKKGKQVNVLSPMQNQNQPKPCGASFAFAVTSAMSDQFNKIKDVNFPLIRLSPQMMMLCLVSPADRNCEYRAKASDTNLQGLLHSLKFKGLPDETCNN